MAPLIFGWRKKNLVSSHLKQRGHGDGGGYVLKGWVKAGGLGSMEPGLADPRNNHHQLRPSVGSVLAQAYAVHPLPLKQGYVWL